MGTIENGKSDALQVGKFDKILIANRGEIACRVMETAQNMSIRTVAVYSDADRAARHVQLADQAVHIGGSAPKDSYLNAAAIIAAAKLTGAQAVHPGYGFLSENPDFVDALTNAGLIFIGPSADAIRSMGLKDAAKALMAKAGVPVVPGYHGSDQDAAHLASEAHLIGYPVLIKAVAGGGGKGMRLVETPQDFEHELKSAVSEAINAFGNGDVLIEKYIEKPRHIEVQVFGDGTDVVHLFERDCSLQRRHQKVIEEAPAPGMTREMRTAMCDAAVRAAAAIGYQSAGTIEFIVDASDGLRPDRFWFMEMNTRLQVEHPVTEAVTGVDLVRWQLDIAAGNRLPLSQEKIRLNGHAIEARLYAEDPANDFLPVTGRIETLQFPANARIDSGVRAGDTVSPFYDPMIAKITCVASDRNIAISKLIQAISDTDVGGTITNRTFLGKLASHPDFGSGDVDTGLIARGISQLTAPDAPSISIIAFAGLVASGLDNATDRMTGFSIWEPSEISQQVLHGDVEHSMRIAVLGPAQMNVVVGEAVIEFHRIANDWRATSDGQRYKGRKTGAIIRVSAERSWEFSAVDPLLRDAAMADAGNFVEAPMPGLIKAVMVMNGATVSAGDPMVTLEAMKMEHVLTAPKDGVIAGVLVQVDDQVTSGAILVEMQEDAE